ncbi:MAG: hypothetical protein ACTSR2_08545, partial [Candidatus Hodarchaeales archaeon]
MVFCLSCTKKIEEKNQSYIQKWDFSSQYPDDIPLCNSCWSSYEKNQIFLCDSHQKIHFLKYLTNLFMKNEIFSWEWALVLIKNQHWELQDLSVNILNTMSPLPVERLKTIAPYA